MNKLFLRILRILMLHILTIPITPLQSYQPTGGNVRISKTPLYSSSSQNIVFSQREKTILIGGGIALVMVGCAYWKYYFKKTSQPASENAPDSIKNPIAHYIKPDNLFIQKQGDKELKSLTNRYFAHVTNNQAWVISLYKAPEQQHSYILAALFGPHTDSTSMDGNATYFAQETFALFFHRAFMINKDVENAFIISSAEINAEIEHKLNPNDPQPGTTAIAIVITANRLYTANVGGPRPILAFDNGQVMLLSRDHTWKNSEERNRLPQSRFSSILSMTSNPISARPINQQHRHLSFPQSRGWGYKYINEYIIPTLQGARISITTDMKHVTLGKDIIRLNIPQCLKALKT